MVLVSASSPRDHAMPRDPAALDAARLALRRGQPVVLTTRAERFVVIALDGLGEAARAWFESVAVGGVDLVLSTHRALALGLVDQSVGGVVRLPVVQPLLGSVEALAALANPLLPSQGAVAGLGRAVAGDMTALAALHLAKLSELLPALLLARADEAAGADLPVVSCGDALARSVVGKATLRRVGEAAVPLIDAEDARILAFRPADGSPDQLAILIGTPDPSGPVLTRLHSSCLTGDLLGSLRCDCGDQLRGAISAIAAAGGGVLLYLAQEGRGIGIANKLRAYELQDQGADTLEANEQLGFAQDERSYALAAAILRDLGIAQVRLLTNNPKKMAGLTEAGIAVTERVAHHFPANPHNRRYLQTKTTKGGHLL